MARIAQEPDVERAIALLLDTLRKGYAVDEVHFCGSRARGDFRPDSDVDLAVVLHGARCDIWGAVRRLAEMTFDILMETGVALSPMAFWHEDFEHPVLVHFRTDCSALVPSEILGP